MRAVRGVRIRDLGLVAAVAALVLVGWWWSSTRVDVDARSRAVDLVWAELETALHPVVTAAGAVILSPALAPDLRSRLADTLGASAAARTIDQRVVALRSFAAAADEVTRTAAADPKVMGDTAVRTFVIRQAETGAQRDRAAARFDAAVEAYHSRALAWPWRIVSGLGDPTRPLFGR